MKGVSWERGNFKIKALLKDDDDDDIDRLCFDDR